MFTQKKANYIFYVCPGTFLQSLRTRMATAHTENTSRYGELESGLIVSADNHFFNSILGMNSVKSSLRYRGVSRQNITIGFLFRRNL